MSAVVVALETSVRAASIAVRRGERRAAATLEAERAHASDLLPRLEVLLHELGAKPSDIRTVLVGTGPGSYTGLRVGIATALGLARGSGADLLSLPSVEVLAYGALDVNAEGSVLLDARGGELYYAHYRRTDQDVEALQAPCVLAPNELGAHLPHTTPIFGDAGVARAAALDDPTRARLRTDMIPRAQDLLTLGERRLAVHGPTPKEAIEPLYLRPFAARTRRR
ncbi:MAG: tRNA (adenosine(37)-N6)-threonylcarbamoyltransferase complex dimerization subunit type 1 TsaB [bacterium]|nr:tRNA (adenosine(37)-N6)-threonylcarbamoyltransferase complex dimerization subunit type 1 TsaB [bacterium]